MKWLIFFLLITGVCYAQDFQDFGTDSAGSLWNDTRFFQGDTIFSASDETVQKSLQSLDVSGVTVILNCKITDSFCFKFEEGILTLFVNGKSQNTFPF